MKRGREVAADEPEATIGAEQSAAVAAAAGGAAESAVAAKAGGAATVVPAPAAIAAVEAPVGEHKVGEDLEEEEEMRRRKRKVHDEIEELFEENAIKEFGVDCRKGSDFDEDAIDELSEIEDDDDVDYSMDNRHNKNRYTLRHLIAGKIKYRFFGKIGCPFCCKVIGGEIDGMIQHAFSTGNGHGKKHKASTLAKHAAYARFLEIVKVNEPYNMH
ncbi:hypothetical protein VPH35_068167 [Triticum aestivum]